MAPLPQSLFHILARSAPIVSPDNAITGLAVSSLELDKRSITPDLVSGLPPRSEQPISHDMVARASKLFTRATAATYTPCAGCKAPGEINNQFFFALFAILGVAMIMGSLWFFFWAKNGGFQFREGDWDDYKTTVTRRKGPDGKTLSNATKSTKLGGGSIVHNQRDRWAAKSVIARDEKGRKGILGKRGFAGTHSVGYRDDFTNYEGTQADEMSETSTYYEPRPTKSGHHSQRYRDRDVKHYKHEKVARVGGINRAADGSHFDFSGTDGSQTERSSEVDDRRRARAEKKAKIEASNMERQWKREAERAAASLARENAVPAPAPAPVPRATPLPKTRTPSPAKKPAGAVRAKRNSTSRTPSPTKRDFSFQKADDVASTAYTGQHTASSSDRQSSYYDAYRPHAARETPQSRSRQQSPRKGGGGGGSHDVMAGYRRGTSDY